MKITICGGGALGSHLLYLSRSLPNARFGVIDNDRVETKNLAAQWFVKPMLGKNKATALKLQMANFFGCAIDASPVRLSKVNMQELLGSTDLVVDCFDNGASRQLVQDFVRETSTPCVHAGLAADGTFGAVRWDRDFVIDHDPVEGQATCEGGAFLPLIVQASVSLVEAIRTFQRERSETNWNIRPGRTEKLET